MLLTSLVYFSILSGLVDGDDDKDKAKQVKTEQINTIKAEGTVDNSLADDRKAKKEATEKEKSKREREHKAELAEKKEADKKAKKNVL